MSEKVKIESRFPLSRELLFKKILIIRFSSLGDIILTTPLLKLLRKNFSNSQIDYCTRSSYSEILKFNQNINNIIETGDELSFSELKDIKKKLVNEHYDLILDLHNNLRTFYLKLFLKFRTKVLVFKKYSFRKFLLVKFKINLMKNLPVISQRYIDVLNPVMSFPPRFSLSAAGRRDKLQRESRNQDNPIDLKPEIYTNNFAIENVNKLINDFNFHSGAKLICIVPSSKHFTKTYPAEYYVELINKFPKESYTFVLVGKGNDRYSADKIISGTGNNVYNLCDKLNLLELTELMKKCDLVITGDTGPMHIAEAVNVPMIIMAGSSVKEFGFYTASPFPSSKGVLSDKGGENNNSIVKAKTKVCFISSPLGRTGGAVFEIHLPCRPCSHIGKDHCPKNHFKCMRDIKPEMVYDKIKKILNQ